MGKKYGYLGPRGTYSEEALALFLGMTEGERIPLPTIEGIIQDVKDGVLDCGLVPLENSIEGTVNLALDLIADYSSELQIMGEVVLSVSHNLLVRPGTKPSEVHRIVSHPQALAQCRQYLNRSFPGVAVAEVSSTGLAAQMAAETPGLAAVANARAAQNNGLEIIARDIQDCQENSTRFVCVSRESQPLGRPTKTSLVISITDRPGALYQILREFALADINLTKIESRPAKKTLGKYLFFIDFTGHRDDPGVRGCLEAVEEIAASVKVLGSYPAWGDAGVAEGGPVDSPTLPEIRQAIDRVDRQIVELLARRTKLVSVVGTLKEETRIRDQVREDEVMKKVMADALRTGVDPALVERVFQLLFAHFVEMQERLHKPRLVKPALQNGTK